MDVPVLERLVLRADFLVVVDLSQTAAIVS
jgi:hypothetical protein